MKRNMTGLILMAALLGTATMGRANDTNATGNNNNPIEHPMNAYTNHEVKEDMKDSKEYGQRTANAKTTYEQARTDYRASLSANGATSQTTREAKVRMHIAHQDMRNDEIKLAQANLSLKKDEKEAQQ